MEAKELTSQQRIEILEDVLKKLESGDTEGGLCFKIIDSSFEIFDICEFKVKNIIPLLTIENARKVTEVKDSAVAWSHWWNYDYESYDYESYDFENRIKFVKWMIEMEKSLLNK